MSNRNKNDEKDSKNNTIIENKKSPVPQKYQDELPYFKAIRASWIGNKSHGDENYKNKRETLIRNNAGMCELWQGEVGFLRYYLHLLDNGYIPGKKKIERIDPSKGFSPDNIRIIDKPVKKPPKQRNNRKENSVIEVTTSKVQELNNQEAPANIINNTIIVTDGNTIELVKKLIGIQSLEGHKGIMLLDNISKLKTGSAQ